MERKEDRRVPSHAHARERASFSVPIGATLELRIGLMHIVEATSRLGQWSKPRAARQQRRNVVTVRLRQHGRD